jgi:hypothetical protein
VIKKCGPKLNKLIYNLVLVKSSNIRKKVWIENNNDKNKIYMFSSNT